MNQELTDRLSIVRERIRGACVKAGRKENEVTLIAVSKTKPWEDVEAFASLGMRAFGENYVQEALEKQKKAAQFATTKLDWHFIGTLQSNKAKFIPGNFSLFHALHSFSLAQKLNGASAAEGLVQDCLLEVNVDLEATKGGVAQEAITRLLEQLNPLKNLRVTGLMCIPAPSAHRDARAPFAKLRELLDFLNKEGSYREKLSELSMGMSADFEAAIQEGATLIRLGTVLFGERARK